jgi:hypothetical protein
MARHADPKTRQRLLHDCWLAGYRPHELPYDLLATDSREVDEITNLWVTGNRRLAEAPIAQRGMEWDKGAPAGVQITAFSLPLTGIEPRRTGVFFGRFQYDTARNISSLRHG